MLSFAGRIALLKSVLASIPIYYMSVAALPTKTITIVDSLMRHFVWGKLRDERYISFISWSKIYEEQANRGLGVRDTKIVNQALLLRIVWYIAANDNKIWAQVMRARYFPRSGF